MVVDPHGFFRPRPWWHGHDEEAQRFRACVAKLKMRVHWNGQTDTRIDLDDFFAVFKFAPDLASASNEEPDFCHSPMANG